jgi:hypothetical protein
MFYSLPLIYACIQFLLTMPLKSVIVFFFFGSVIVECLLNKLRIFFSVLFTVRVVPEKIKQKDQRRTKLVKN